MKKALLLSIGPLLLVSPDAFAGVSGHIQARLVISAACQISGDPGSGIDASGAGVLDFGFQGPSWTNPLHSKTSWLAAQRDLPLGSQVRHEQSGARTVVGWDGLVYLEGLAEHNSLGVERSNGGDHPGQFWLAQLDAGAQCGAVRIHQQCRPAVHRLAAESVGQRRPFFCHLHPGRRYQRAGRTHR